MKNLASLAAFFVISSFSVFAQKGDYKMGVSLGSAYSTINSDLFTTASGRPSGMIGCSFTIGISDRFEFNQDISFLQKGGSAKAVRFMPEEQTEITSFDYHYNAFEVSALAGYKISNNLPFYLHAGGFMGSHFHNTGRIDRDKYVGDYTNVNNAVKAVDLMDAFSGVDFGPVVGLTGSVGAFRANLRYAYGVRNLYKNLDFVAPGRNINTQSLRFTLTYFFKR